MRSALAKRILSRTTPETHHKVKTYAALVARINHLFKQKGLGNNGQQRNDRKNTNHA